MSNSPLHPNETKHEVSHSAGTPQGENSGRHFIGFPADSSETASCRVHPDYRDAPYYPRGVWREEPAGSNVWRYYPDKADAPLTSKSEIREFIHDTLARCLSRIYYRSDPREIRKVVDGTEDPS